MVFFSCCCKLFSTFAPRKFERDGVSFDIGYEEERLLHFGIFSVFSYLRNA
jgi:hypothetical protein